tara:strand:- start:333 stop:641 length:309 start_codon:yes stop_codon:yes gene_type:complete
MKKIAEATRTSKFSTYDASKGLDSNMKTRCTDNCKQFGKTANPFYDSIKWKDIKQRGGWWYNIRDTPGKRARRVCPNCASNYSVKGKSGSLSQPLWSEVFRG